VETCAAASAGPAGEVATGVVGAVWLAEASGFVCGGAAVDCPWLPGHNSNKHTSPAINVFGNDIMTPQQFKTKISSDCE